jgi:hypothetical protein
MWHLNMTYQFVPSLIEYRTRDAPIYGNEGSAAAHIVDFGSVGRTVLV